MSSGTSSLVYTMFSSKSMLAILTDDSFFSVYVTKTPQYITSQTKKLR